MFGGPILEVVEACKKNIKSTTQTTQKEATTDSSIMETRARLLIIQYNFDKRRLLSCSNVDLE